MQPKDTRTVVVQVRLTTRLCPHCDQPIYRSLHKDRVPYDDSGGELVQGWVEENCDGPCQGPLATSSRVNQPLTELLPLFQEYDKGRMKSEEFDQRMHNALENANAKWHAAI